MTREIEVLVPLPHHQTMALLLQAAEALQHRVVQFDVAQGAAVIHVDFSFKALSTFHVHAQARALPGGETHLHLRVRPSFKLGFFTGVGQSERIAWQLVGKMQQIMDPKRYEALEDNVIPSRAGRFAGRNRPGGP